MAADGDHAGAVRAFDAALRTWRGTPYSEFADEEWAIAESQRLLELRAAAIEDRAESQLALGGHAGVVADLERFTREQQTRERPRAQLMVALYRSGRQADALRVYQDYFAHMRDEMGLEPSRTLRDLESKIIAGDPSLDLGAVGGQTLRGYQLFEELGRGAFSIVHRGTQPSVGRDVAVKTIRSELANDPDFVRRFETEAHLVANLEHPHIVPLYDFWREPDGAYLVMRWLRGGTLRDRLTDGPLDLATAATLVRQVGGALEAAHRHGIVHRDIKPANVFCDDEGNFYLGDFGIAIGDTADADAIIHATTAPAYASPELLERQPAGPTADIYSLGATIFESLTGASPFADAASDEELIRRQIHEPLPPVSSIRAGIPSRIDEVVGRATAKSVVGRYASAREFVTAFNAAFEPEGSRAVAPTVPAAEPGPNPYKGLQAFHEADAADFFGRSALVDEFLDVLRQESPAGRLITVVGPSGSGKSSVVRAGLVPALREGAIEGSADWFVATAMPGSSPFAELEAALLRIAVNPPPSLLDQLTSSPDGISRAVKRVLPSDDAELLLILDQAEELFTLTSDAGEATAFIDGLLAAVDDPHSRLRVVATIRADFYDRPLANPRFAGRVKQSTVIVTPMAPDELAEAIALPARRAGAAFEDGLVARITADVADQPGTLPLLQYTLAELYDRSHGHLTHQLYEELGGVAGALAGRAERIHNELSADGQAGARLLFTRLVTIGEDTDDTRRRVTRAELASVHRIATALQAYESSRLLTFDRDGESREPTVEIAHEALIREWPRYRAWIDDDRDGLRVQRHLTASAQAWSSRGEDDADLYRGARLEAAHTWRTHHPGETNELEDRFLEAGELQRNAEIDRARLQSSRLKRSLAAVAVVAVVAIVAGLLALREQRRADDALDIAKAEQQRAEERRADEQFSQLTDAAASVDDPRLSVLLAFEANRLREGSPEALDGLAHGLFSGLGPVSDVAGAWVEAGWDEDHFLTFDEAGVKVRSTVAPYSIVGAIPVPPTSVALTPPAAAPAGDRFAVASGEGFVIVDAVTGEAGPSTGQRGTAGIFSTSAWTANELVVIGDDPIQVFRVDGVDAQLVATVPQPVQGLAPWMRAHPTEPLLAVMGAGATVEIWDTTALAEGVIDPRAVYDIAAAGVSAGGSLNVRYSPNGERLYVWNLLDLDAGVYMVESENDPIRLPFDLRDFGGGTVRELENGDVFVGGKGRAMVATRSGAVITRWNTSSDFSTTGVAEMDDGRFAVARIPSLPPPQDCAGCKVEVWKRDDSLPVTSVLPEFGNLNNGKSVQWFPEEQLATVMQPIFGGLGQTHEMHVLELWDLSAGAPRQVTLAGGPEYRAVRVSQTERGVLAAGLEGTETIRIHDTRTGEVLHVVAVDHAGTWVKLHVSRDGWTLRVFDNTLRRLAVYDLRTGQLTGSRTFDRNGAWTIYNEQEGWGLLTGSSGTDRFDLESLEDLDSRDASYWLPGRDGSSESYSLDGELIIEDTTTGERSVLSGDGDDVFASVPSSGEFAIGWDARAQDGQLQWYHRESGLAIGPSVSGPVNDQHLEGTAVTQVIDGRVHVWNTDPETWWDRACVFAGRTLTEAEWESYLPDDMPYDPACT